MALKRDFSQMLMNARSKWVNVFKTAYFFGQGPSCRPCYTHKKKSIHNGRSPNVWGIVEKGPAVSRSTICLLGVGFSLRQVVFVHLVYFYQDCTMILGTCFNYFLATLRLQEQNNVFLDEMPFIHKVLMVVWMGPHVDMHFCGSATSWRNQLHVHKMGPRTGLRRCL